MKSIKTLLVLALVAAAAFTFVGCKEKSESEKLGDAVSDAADKTKDAAKDAADKTADAAKDAAAATKEVVTNAVEKATH